MRAPDRYAVVGHPIAHSLSPRIHALFAQQMQQNLQYTALDVSASQLAHCVREFFAGGGRGLNVTVPHKQAVMALLERLSDSAKRADAVNTIALDDTGALLGDNTDGVGLVRDLTQNLRIAVGNRRILLLGAGGAARGVLGPLLGLAPRELVIANRSLEPALALAQQWATVAAVRAVAFGKLAELEFDLIINATAASLLGEVPAVPPSVLRAGTVCYDLAYGGHPTAFLQWARGLGVAQAYTGLGMLVEQAAEAFVLWRGVRPETAPVLAALRAEGAVV